MAECLGSKLSKSVLKLVGVRGVPYRGCECLWCCEVFLAKRVTLWPACNCKACAAHPANHMPEHFLRSCPHRVYWTINQGDRDECVQCDDEKQRDKALSDLPLPDYPIVYEQ